MNKKAKKEIFYMVVILFVLGYGFSLLKLTDNPKYIEWGSWATKTIEAKEEHKITMDEYVNQKFGSEAWKAFAILHGTKYCGGENGKHNPDAINVNNGGSIDRGYWQFNDKFHPEVSNECAKDVVCSTDRAYQMFIHDGSFKQWSAGKCIGV